MLRKIKQASETFINYWADNTFALRKVEPERRRRLMRHYFWGVFVPSLLGLLALAGVFLLRGLLWMT